MNKKFLSVPVLGTSYSTETKYMKLVFRVDNNSYVQVRTHGFRLIN